MIIISGHASFINGKIFEAPVNTLAETLIAEKKDFIHIRHSIDGSLKSKVYFYKKGILASEEKLPVLQRVSILRYLSEIVATFIFLCRLKSQSKIYIGADPLNAFSGVLARKADGIQKSVFFTADYSEKRFGNPALNFFYQSLDRFCIRKADFVWNVSSRIYNLRAKMGVGKRNKLVPNIPSDEYKKYLKNQKNKFHLITMGILGDQFDFNNLFLALKELISTDKEIVLDIVGDGPKKEAFVKAVSELGIANNVKFWGYVDHSIALELVSKSGIGLALYNGNWSFNYFGDSMKCREFFSFGLPVISTDTHSTVDEIKDHHAGIICKMSKDEYKAAVLEIIERYDYFSQNSSELGKKYEGIHSKMIKSLEQGG